MQTVFGEKYSCLYDLLYENKDYEAECDFLEAIFEKYNLNIETILDLGCGTGGHLIPLAKRGYQVTGVDRSEYMLKCARKKIEQENVEGRVYLGDICSVDLGRQFDAVISMFAVMSYLTTNEQVASACRVARNHVDPSGVFIFDVWHGPGVLTERPTQRIKRIQSDTGEIVRFVDPVIDVFTHTVETHFQLWNVKAKRIVTCENESHIIRFFFPQEIAYFLEVAGFFNIGFCPFMDANEKVDESVWNMTVIGRLV